MTKIKQALLSMLPRSGPTTGVAKNVVVRLEPSSRRPETPVERETVSVLMQAGAMPLDRLVERVAFELYRKELRSGAQTLDIGLFGSRLFVPEVADEIGARAGTLWQIEQPEKF